jgi:hypothetical protein
MAQKRIYVYNITSNTFTDMYVKTRLVEHAKTVTVFNDTVYRVFYEQVEKFNAQNLKK